MTPSHPRRKAHRALVVHPDPGVRDGWSRALEATGFTVIRCVGPTVSCILDRGSSQCPLLDEVELAVYADHLLTPELVTKLAATRPPMMVGARDRHRADGDHEPVFSRTIHAAV